jgi:hypothetical protein
MKFSFLHGDIELQKIQQEIEDKLADSSEVDKKLTKTTAIQKGVPKLVDMADGEEIAYDDATNQWIYRRIGAKLYKWQLTEV